MCDTTLQTDNTYEKDLGEILPINTKDLPGVENKYDGLRFNAQIGKYLHVEECSHPYIARGDK